MRNPLAHERLLGLSDLELRMICSEATHQHFKGGLYKYIGPIHDADSGSFMRTPAGDFYEGYLHVHPHDRQLWARPSAQFNGVTSDGSPRFRKLG